MTERLTHALADRYRIVEHLGEGGMANVYLAEDLKHDRKVAVKVLRPELAVVLGSERFLQEIKTTAGLQHPHILPLFDSGQAGGRADGQHEFLYYVMPYVEGETLREKLTREKQLGIDEAVRIATEVAEALDYAHRKGVIHRDIKPENILLHDGRAMVADFGIALAADALADERLTGTGITLGTPQYMSPEQASGDREIGPATDIYAVGCVLYEMLAGEPPHTGATAQAVVARVLTEPPRSVSAIRNTVSQALDRVLERALAKVPSDRFPSADDLAAAITGARPSRSYRVLQTGRRRWKAVAFAAVGVAAAFAVWPGRSPGASGLDATPRVAVLPLDNLMGDSMAFFVAGMHDALIGELARINGLAVVSRTSVRQFAADAPSIPEIARALDVDLVVEGSVFSDGRTVRVRTQLVGVNPERDLWSASYDRPLGNALSIHTDIARAIAQQVEVTLTPQDEASLGRDVNVDPAALTAYLRGRHFFSQFGSPAEDSLARLHYERAILLDPTFAPAYAGLADLFLVRYDAVAEPGADPLAVRDRAVTLAEQALAYDSTLAEAYTALGGARLWFDWDWDGAETAFQRALDLNPSFAQGHQWYAFLLMTTGRMEEAIQRIGVAARLDPFSPVITWSAGRIYFLAGRLVEADSTLNRLLELDPRNPAGLGILSAVRFAQNDLDAATDLHARSLEGMTPPVVANTIRAAAARGDRARVWDLSAAACAAAGPACPQTITITMNLRLGRNDEALSAVERAYERRWLTRSLDDLVWNPELDPLRDRPRFVRVVEAIGLPQIRE